MNLEMEFYCAAKAHSVLVMTTMSARLTMNFTVLAAWIFTLRIRVTATSVKKETIKLGHANRLAGSHCSALLLVF